MDKKESFENGIIKTKSVEFRGATQNVVNFAAEFAKRGVNLDSGFEK